MALSSLRFRDLAFATGTPMNWLITRLVFHHGLKTSLAEDEGNIDDLHLPLNPFHSSLELEYIYCCHHC